CFQGSHVPYTF
nr:immunoglobulin light chain junction region [Mus musculus]NSL97023.1 immunoglobulin light chain junction region [Mus musculus]NSL97164.1 immunoglobulin light chain junction region [Mus musculus]NSL97209.1 immunoglobulin light chain junction region [Mus musculus]NSL97262.1 immunoglobulin light chain junction region [Mus musculus]